MKKLLQILADLRFAVFLLLVIACISSVGSIIEQDKDINFYLETYPNLIFNQPLGFYFVLFELNSIYSAPWFFFLLILFGSSLLSCTVLTQFPALKFARRYYFYTSTQSFKKLENQFLLKKNKKSKLSYYLTQQDYILFQQQSSFYGYKGLIGRISPIFVHFSILFILGGSIFGALTGFNSQELVPKSEIFHIQNVVKRGIFSNLKSKTFRINDFWINYGTNNLPKQFYTDLSIINGNGIEVSRKTISVNNPSQYSGLTIYQTDWGISGIRIAKGEKQKIIQQLPVSLISNKGQKFWISWLPNKEDMKGYFLFLNRNPYEVEIYDKNLNFLDSFYLEEKSSILPFSNFYFLEIIFSTGVQIKMDPGIKLIYFGFAFLIVSTFFSYISFSEIWFFAQLSNFNFGGKTNRAKIKFQLQLAKLQQLF